MSNIDQKTLRTVAAGVVGGVIGGTLGIVPIAGWLIGGIVGGVAAALVADRLGESERPRPSGSAHVAEDEAKAEQD